MNKRATIQDVAKKAGVSRAAVSKVLRNAYGLSDDMRRRVETAMGELSYRPQMAARGLRGSTYTLGILLPDIRNPFFPDILDGVSSALSRTQYKQLLGVRPSAEATERELVETMLDRKLDGLIMVGPKLDNNYLKSLAHQVPLVLIGRSDHDCDFDTVNNDDEAGAHLIVDHFVSQGHTRIEYFGVDAGRVEGANSVVVRQEAFLKAMTKHGLAASVSLIVNADYHWRDSDLASAKEWLSKPDRPSAVFCWTDSVAIILMAAAQELGLKVPEDIAIAGYDNSRIAALPQISLTSVDQSAKTLGEKAAELLIERIEGREREMHFVTEPKLCVRRSSNVNHR